MASEKNAVALTGFFSSLFHNLPRLLLTNVLFVAVLRTPKILCCTGHYQLKSNMPPFALPFAVIFGIFFLINTLTGLNSMFIYFLTIIPLFPFYAGVTQVTSHMVRGEENVDVFSNFIGGIKENLLRFLIHGGVMYALFLSATTQLCFISDSVQRTECFMFRLLFVF